MQTLRDRLEALRERLLDLSFRNRLLNHSDTGRRILKVRRLSLAELYTVLVDEGKTLTISAAPVETPALLTATGELASEPAPEPFDDTGEEFTSELQRKRLPVAMRAGQLDNRLRTIHSQRKAMLDSTGTNLLYLALGFLEWRDPQNEPDKARLSPLLLVPVEIERDLERIDDSDEKADESEPSLKLRMGVKIYRYTIRHDGEDVSSNLPLILRLRRSPFSLELESYESAEDSNAPSEGSRFDNIEDYFRAVEQAVARLPSDVAVKPWRVIRAARVGFFTFFKEVIWRDLDPDRWPKETPLLEKEWIKAALVGREKVSESNICDDDDERAMRNEPLPTVLDADGTQVRALIRVSRGESLVIQGPPGTGKSQTIANIIAAALAQGKTVLFMAEKLAALNVVKVRLDEAKIGQYCLELHSRQASVKAIHDQVKKRLAITRPPNPIWPTYMLKHFVQHPNKLNGSWDALQKPLDGLGCTFWETIWAAVWTREEFDEATGHRYVGEELPAFQWGESHKQDQDQLTAVIEKAEVLCRLADDGVPERLRIWEGLHPTAIVTQERVCAVRRILESSLAAAKQWSECDATIFPASLSQMTAARARRLASTLPGSLAESWQQPLASGVAAGHSLSDYEEYLSAMDTWHAHAQLQAELLAESPDLTDAELADAFASTREIAEKLRWLATANYAGLRRAAEQLRKLHDLAGLRIQLAEKIAKAFGISGAPPTMAEDSVLTRITRLWAEFGRGDDCCLAECLASATTGEKLDAAEAEAKSLIQDKKELESWFRLRDAPPIDQIARIRQTLSTAQGTWRAWWPFGQTARARKETRVFLRSERALKDAALCDRLNDLEVWPSRLEAFATNAAHRRVLGPGFHGIETNWERLRGAAALAHTVVQWVGPTTARTLLGQAVSIAEAVGATEDSADQLDQCSREFAVLLGQGAAGPCESLSVQPRKTAHELIAWRCASLNGSLSKIECVCPNDNDVLDTIRRTVCAAQNLRSLRARINELVGKPTFLGAAHRGIHHTPLDPLRSTFEWVREFTVLPDLPAPCVAWLLETDSAQRLIQLRDATGKLSERIEAWRATADGLASFAQIDSSAALAAANQERTASEVCTAFKEAIGAVTALPQQADYLRVRKWFDDHYHDELLSFLKRRGLPVQKLAVLAPAAFWDAWLRVAETSRPEAFEMARHEKEATLKKFQSDDRDLSHHYRAVVTREVYRSRAQIAPGRQVGRAADLTNLALIDREIRKQKRHVPARELVRRSGRALQQLMPCWMMGPGAVAQFLPAGGIEFDMLVVDEASQVRPEDSLGSLARAKQVVIVGDSKQMPPTDVFSVHAEHDEDDEDETGPAEELESVLDVFSNFLSAPFLGWHYRSQHHSLILYSNEFFYDRRLLIPPSTQIADGPLGVKLHYCANANFTNRRNPVEAEEVVRLLSQHIIANANEPSDRQESVAVVTMSRTQQELIEELFDRKTKECPDLASALECFKPSAPVIIRNLENIQGDERDVVIISFTYGPDVATGKVFQRFPLINRAGGWRRLNVLFTRARMRTIVVSSMKSEQILPRAERTDDGVVHLRNYLKFAETGRLPDSPNGPRREPDSEFERSVGRIVQSLGFDVHFQIGTMGFFIDLAIPDPASSARYLCGIECDGAPYHSHPTARDRDRLREDILRARGWDIYRIWSTDWYRNRETEVGRLRGYLRQKAGIGATAAPERRQANGESSTNGHDHREPV
jgi:very-short-patch-repair endonuclease